MPSYDPKTAGTSRDPAPTGEIWQDEPEPTMWLLELFEKGCALNPSDGGDTNTVMASGYTAIESYINELADQLVP